MAWDSYSGSVLAIDGESIVRLIPPAEGGLDAECAWTACVLAGDRDDGGTPQDGRGKAARFAEARHLTCDQRGVAYVADGSLIRKQPGGGGAVADLVIRVGERRFHCHRAILSARCDYFKHRLAGDAFEDARAAELELPDADPDTFALLLRWLYTGGADILPKQARGVAELADRLLLPELCARALDVLFASVDAGSIVDSLLWAAGCCEAHGGGGAFDQLLLRLKRWYVERAAEVRAAARDSLRALMTQQPDLMLELMEASEQRAVKRARTK
eukprot:XP_001692154.1 predicted protein [Chlamydomonas reinhardtii]